MNCVELATISLPFEMFLDGFALIHGTINGFHRIDKHVLCERTKQMLRYKLRHGIYQFLEENRRCTRMLRVGICVRTLTVCSICSFTFSMSSSDCPARSSVCFLASRSYVSRPVKNSSAKMLPKNVLGFNSYEFLILWTWHLHRTWLSISL